MDKIVESRLEIIEMIKKLSLYFNNVRDALCAPYGLSSIQAVIVLDIYHNPTENKVTDICRRLNKSTNTISPLINRLVDKGFLTKTQGKEDARVTYINLTEKTKKITDSISVDICDFAWPMFDSLTEAEFKNIHDSLKLLLKVTSE
ncbi:MAG: MarR family transcriptional regulator [Erysipelotrichaceae bacterium]|nr:MarR family transcriptional regulator [Erysipelotrichaceae bacterium]